MNNLDICWHCPRLKAKLAQIQVRQNSPIAAAYALRVFQQQCMASHSIEVTFDQICLIKHIEEINNEQTAVEA